VRHEGEKKVLFFLYDGLTTFILLLRYWRGSPLVKNASGGGDLSGE
jgi:hypothetical protein